jgi:hypothetical protein
MQRLAHVSATGQEIGLSFVACPSVLAWCVTYTRVYHAIKNIREDNLYRWSYI